MMKNMVFTLLFSVFLFVTVGCEQKSAPQPDSKMVIKPGGIYSCNNGGGNFGIVKVLVVEDGSVHVMMYGNQFKERPKTIDPKELQVFIGHAPMSEAGFRKSEPFPLMVQSVTEAELEGYRLWKNR